jgi:hypothetical protein
MLEVMEGTVNIAQKGNVNIFLVLVPSDGETAVVGGIPVGGDSVGRARGGT